MYKKKKNVDTAERFYTFGNIQKFELYTACPARERAYEWLPP